MTDPVVVEPDDQANDADDQANDADDQADEQGAAGREAAKYRRRLRETEAERDGLAARVERQQLREVDRLAAERLAEPGDLRMIGGAQLEQLLTEDGDIDPAAVAAAVDELLTTRPGLARQPVRRMPDLGQRSSAYADALIGPSGYQAILRGH